MSQSLSVQFEDIREPYLYGIRGVTLDTSGNKVGTRMAEVCRTDSCSNLWACFCYNDGKMVVLGYNPPDTDFATAKRKAVHYLKTGECGWLQSTKRT